MYNQRFNYLHFIPNWVCESQLNGPKVYVHFLFKKKTYTLFLGIHIVYTQNLEFVPM
jgi:hypothetical protein